MASEIYDKIYIGSGPILLLDAINESLKGTKTLTLDKNKVIGGAWKTINIFGFNNLENAVHYLMPNKNGYKFLEEIMDIKLGKRGYNKYYARSYFGINILFKTNNLLGKLITKLESKNFNIKYFRNFLKEFFKENSINYSRYPIKGSKVLLDKITNLINKTKLKIRLNEEVIGININKKKVRILTKKGEYFANQIVISHGFIPPPELNIFSKKIKLKKKIFPRPSLHILINLENNNSNTNKINFSQILFQKSSPIKYLHEITQFIDKEENNNNKYVIVAALRHNLKNNIRTKRLVINELLKFKILPELKTIKEIDFYWQDIFLPMINNADLKKLKKAGNGRIKVMRTEELASAFSYYEKDWNYLKDLMKITF